MLSRLVPGFLKRLFQATPRPEVPRSTWTSPEGHVWQLCASGDRSLGARCTVGWLEQLVPGTLINVAYVDGDGLKRYSVTNGGGYNVATPHANITHDEPLLLTRVTVLTHTDGVDLRILRWSGKYETVRMYTCSVLQQRPQCAAFRVISKPFPGPDVCS